MSSRRSESNVWTRRVAPAVALIAVLGLAAGCSSDSDESAQEEYCQAGDDLKTDVTSLASLDLVAGGTDGLDSALSSIEDDVDDLTESASDAAQDEVDALNDSVDDLQSSVDDLGGDLTSENASAVAGAVQSVIDSADAVYTTLSDC